MTVEENLWLGAYLMDRKSARHAADAIFEKYPRLAARRKHPAKVLSGGERRLLEICRALVMNPSVLLVDEPSIGLEPRFIDAVFDILGNLQHNEGKTIVMVEQNAKKGLEFSDIGYVLVSGKLAMAGKASELLTDRCRASVSGWLAGAPGDASLFSVLSWIHATISSQMTASTIGPRNSPVIP